MTFRWRRAAALFRVETRCLLMDRSALLLIFGLPLMQVALYGYGVGFLPRHIPVAFSTDDPVVSMTPPARLLNDDTVQVTGPAGKLGEAERAVREGKAQIGVEVTKPVGDGPRGVTVFVDGSDPATVNPILERLNVIFWRRAAQYEAAGEIPAVRVHWLFGDAARESWAVSPGLIGLVVMVTMLFLGALCLVRERERGTWESLLATPVRPAEALAGKLAPYVLIGFIETVLLLGFIHVAFDVPLPLTSIALIAISPLFAASYLLLGFTFSTLAQTQLQAVQGAVGVYLPSLLLSGFLFPFSGMPTWARWLGSALPLTHFIRASRDILLRQAPASSLWLHLWPIGLFTVATLIAALLAFRRHLE